MKTTLGGERLGSGKKQEVSMRNYERSTHDLSYAWRSSMAAGTLVPFMNLTALPGDSFEIDLEASVRTLPTVGPLFGSYKVQLDVFQCPYRLYNGKLHMNMLNIGMDMKSVLLPQKLMKAYFDKDNPTAMQINPSSIHAYLGQAGLGIRDVDTTGIIERQFNAVPYLAYWDVYKQYYANKQEEKGAFISTSWEPAAYKMGRAYLNGMDVLGQDETFSAEQLASSAVFIALESNYFEGQPDAAAIKVLADGEETTLGELYGLIIVDRDSNGHPNAIQAREYSGAAESLTINIPNEPILFEGSTSEWDPTPNVNFFDLSNIDDMRMDILADVKSEEAFVISYADSKAPYHRSLGSKGDEERYFNVTQAQAGLGLKTHQSDLFNNWISTEWIDGDNGINSITAIDTSSGEFTIDTLNLSNKVYNMLNRIALSGGTYKDFIETTSGVVPKMGIEEPVYHGSLIKELGFEEVVSTAQTEETPLGQLAGRGALTQKHKGGKVKIKVYEHSVILGIVSITPRIDYSQGNQWDGDLKNMDEFHKPELDAIGFQDLLTDQMAWFDTKTSSQGTVSYKSAGKQPAWINYMTAVNKCYGNFAEENKEMYMTLNRRYEYKGGVNRGIKDLTTYIDPSKFNFIFADGGNLDAQNFWVQIGAGVTARRKMSAKIIPNL